MKQEEAFAPRTGKEFERNGKEFQIREVREGGTKGTLEGNKLYQ